MGIEINDRENHGNKKMRYKKERNWKKKKWDKTSKKK